MPSYRPASTLRRRPRRRLRFVLLALAAVPVVAFLHYRLDEAPSGAAQSVASRPARTVADAENAWLYLTGLGAADGVEPTVAGRRHVDAYLAGADRETVETEAVPGVKPDSERDGFATVCRPSLGNCGAWAVRHRDALLRLIEANRLRLTRLDRASALPQWQEPPLRNAHFPPVPGLTVRLQFAALALRGGSGEDPVSLGQEIARHAALWRRADEQADWLLSKMFAETFLADLQRLLVETYARATPDQRRALDPVVDATLAAPSAAAASLDVYAYDASRMSDVIARSLFPGLGAALRRCWQGEDPQPATPPLVDMARSTCSEHLIDNLTFRPQATANRLAPFVDATRTLLAAAPADEADAQQRHADRIRSLRADLETGPRLLPVYNDSGNRFVLLSLDTPDPALNYRRRLNDYELLRRMLVIRITALRANVPDGGMAAFLDTLPVPLRHPYPDKAIRWDDARGVFTAPTAIEGVFDEGGLDVAYREAVN